MNWLDLLRSMQAPAVDTETGYYNTYEPKVSQTITETDDDQPNKRVTKIDYMPTARQFIPGDTGMYGASMSSSFSPTLSQPEDRIPMDQLYTDTRPSNEEIIRGAMADPMYPPVEHATPMAVGAILPRIFGGGKAAKGAADAAAQSRVVVDSSGKVMSATEKAAQVADETARLAGLNIPKTAAIGAGAVGIPTAMRDVPPADQEFDVMPETMTTPGDNPENAAAAVQSLSEIPGDIANFIRQMGGPGPNPGSVTDIETGEVFPLGKQPDTVDNSTETPTATNEGLLSDYYSPQLPGSAPFSALNTNPDSPEGGVVFRMPKPDMSGWKSEGQKAALAEQERKSRIYANYNYDPKEKLAEYEKAMRSIYAKSLLLDAIAQFTGGKSQAKRFVDMATARLEMEEKFDDQERLLNIQRGVYYDENGVYDPPKNEQEAFERVIAFGGSPALAEKIAGYAPKKDTRGFVTWHNPVTGRETQVRTGEHPGPGYVLGKKSKPDLAGSGEERMLDVVQAYVDVGSPDAMRKAYRRVLGIYMGKKGDEFGQQQSTKAQRVKAAMYIFEQLSPEQQAMLTIPEGLNDEQIDEWEKQMKAKGYSGYPMVNANKTNAGIID